MRYLSLLYVRWACCLFIYVTAQYSVLVLFYLSHQVFHCLVLHCLLISLFELQCHFLGGYHVIRSIDGYDRYDYIIYRDIFVSARSKLRVYITLSFHFNY